MTAHLTDLQIAILMSDKGSDALRATLAEHIADCDTCRDLVSCSIRLERDNHDGVTRTVRCPMDVRERLADAYSGFLKSSPESSQRSVFRLREQLQVLVNRVAEHLAEETEPGALPLAADASETDEFPTLATNDRSLLVRFRRVPPNNRLRGYVIAHRHWLPGHLFLRIPAQNLSYKVAENGEVDLPDLSDEDLLSGSIEIALEELPPETS